MATDTTPAPAVTTPRDRNEERVIRAARTKAARAAKWAQDAPPLHTYPRRTK